MKTEEISTMLTLSNDGVVRRERSRQIINNSASQDEDEEDPLKLSLSLVPTTLESYERYEARKRRRRLPFPWTITKQLFKSDVDDSSRLLIQIKKVETYIVPFLNETEKRSLFGDSEGVRMNIFDVDKEEEYGLNLKKWKTGSFVFTTNWQKDFVRRRELVQNDTIGLYFDADNQRLCFGVVDKARVSVVDMVVTPAVADPTTSKRRRPN
ncbi:B3 domain-containing protein At2g33720-like [Impatiens glandulifera]|uniref:B3 domain-containing protein At2g33720-like n=1 Tax=Impatiens glandulifera TaxID=253017 RepID=UPI001FB055C5|nr:B3 domain-containing protein At2g33720-like [Impatiens glandulifera]